MTSTMPANRTQMWIARGTIVACLALIIALKNAGVFGKVWLERAGSTTTYHPTAMLPIAVVALAIITAAVGVVLWMQAKAIFRLFSCVVFLMAIWLVVSAPSMLMQRTVISPNGVSHRVGHWYRPLEFEVQFAEISDLDIEETAPLNSRQRQFELQFVKRSDDERISLPMGDTLKAALPELAKRAQLLGVMIGPTAREWIAEM